MTGNDDEILPEWTKGTESAVDTLAQPTNSTTTTSIEIDTTTQETPPQRNWGEMMTRDLRLLLIAIGIIVVMNIPFLKWIMYPFTIFSTWIHEICHGLAAVMCGGKINKLLIFPDTSGLAYTAIPGNRRGFVSSAGYQGTAVVGCLLLLFRRTKRGPRSGMMALGLFMILSTCIWIRNVFGFCMIFLLGLILMACAWKLPSARMRDVYVTVAVTCALNAITSVRNLFGANHVVNGEPSQTDAHSMADVIGGTSILWATVWLFFAFFMTAIGLVFAIPGPDEVADFKCCGVCVDMGCFHFLNTTRSKGGAETTAAPDGLGSSTTVDGNSTLTPAHTV